MAKPPVLVVDWEPNSSRIIAEALDLFAQIVAGFGDYLGKACPQKSTELSTQCGQMRRPSGPSHASAVMHTRGWLSTIYACLSTRHSASKTSAAARHFRPHDH